MTHDDAGGLGWRRAVESGEAAHCVEVSLCSGVPRKPGARVAVRDSKDPDGPVLYFDEDEWPAFVAGVRTGQFDLAWLRFTVLSGGTLT